MLYASAPVVFAPNVSVNVPLEGLPQLPRARYGKYDELPLHGSNAPVLGSTKYSSHGLWSPSTSSGKGIGVMSVAERTSAFAKVAA